MKKASDFYFHVGYSKEYKGVYVTIVLIDLIDFWNLKHVVDDHHLGISHLTDDIGIYECGESLFDSTSSIEDTRTKMLAAGFLESEDFTNFVSSHDPYCDYESDQD